jgi:hypothetical protein
VGCVDDTERKIVDKEGEESAKKRKDGERSAVREE